MMECSSCGASLRYDIASGLMMCDHCKATYSPDEVWKERVAVQSDLQDSAQNEQMVAGGDSKENAENVSAGDSSETPGQEHFHKEYDVTIFTCPQCGGEILSYQNEANEFCSYCGASVTLAGRLVKEKRPKYIIPFSVTKENCIEAYRKHLKSLPFVPAELKSDEAAQKFCGIYIPFWLYRVTQKGPLQLEGQRQNGEYVEECTINTVLDTTYERICYDASYAFDDTLAAEVAPYEFSLAKEFNPAYLCGFYADQADVDASVYEDKALSEAADQTYYTIALTDGEFSGMTIDSSEKSKIHGKVEGTENILLPVWFMTWRTKNRVSYSVVNGNTQKVTADIPIDTRKYLLFSALLGLALAVVLYFLFPVITPIQSVRISFLAAVVGLWVYQSTFRSRKYREEREYEERFSEKVAYFLKEEKAFVRSFVAVFLAVVFFVIIFLFNSDFSHVAAQFSSLVKSRGGPVLYFVALCLGINLYTLLFDDYRFVHDPVIWRDTLPLIVCAVAGSALHLMSPPLDLYYYAVTLLTVFCLLNILLGLIRQYNDYATRPVPAFHNRKRGDGNV